MRSKPIPPEELATARAMKASGISHREIARTLGRSKACLDYHLNPITRANKLARQKRERNAWSRDELKAAIEMRFVKGLSPENIAQALGRTSNSVEQKLAYRGADGALIECNRADRNITIPEQVLRDRDHRMSLWPSDVMAALMGDPVPGRSALDQRGE